MSNRNYLLAKLDDRRNAGKLPWRLSMENNVTVTLSAYNVKIIKDDRTGVSNTKTLTSTNINNTITVSL